MEKYKILSSLWLSWFSTPISGVLSQAGAHSHFLTLLPHSDLDLPFLAISNLVCEGDCVESVNTQDSSLLSGSAVCEIFFCVLEKFRCLLLLHWASLSFSLFTINCLSFFQHVFGHAYHIFPPPFFLLVFLLLQCSPLTVVILTGPNMAILHKLGVSDFKVIHWWKDGIQSCAF